MAVVVGFMMGPPSAMRSGSMLKCGSDAERAVALSHFGREFEIERRFASKQHKKTVSHQKCATH